MSIIDSKKKIKIPGKDNLFQELKETSKFEEVDQIDDKSTNGSQSGCLSILHKSYSKLLPIVRDLYRCCVREDGEDYETINKRDHDMDNSNNIDLRNLMGFFNQSLYHEYLNITNIMKLKRLDFRDVYGIRSSDLILTRENILERVMLLVTSYFCMGTELRFLKQIGIEGFEHTIDAEYWHGKALEIAVKFLPGDSPLTKHIVSSYSKHHSPSYEQIPEDDEVSSDIKVIKPLNGLDSNRMSPIIKFIESPSVKLSPLDLAANNYLTNYNKSELNLSKTNNISKKIFNSKEAQEELKFQPELKKSQEVEFFNTQNENTKDLSSSTSSSCLIKVQAKSSSSITPTSAQFQNTICAQSRNSQDSCIKSNDMKRNKTINIEENTFFKNFGENEEENKFFEQPKSTRITINSSREQTQDKSYDGGYRVSKNYKWNSNNSNEILISDDGVNVMNYDRPKTSQMVARNQLIGRDDASKNANPKTPTITFDGISSKTPNNDQNNRFKPNEANNKSRNARF